MAKVSSVRGKKQNISRFIAACHRGDEGQKESIGKRGQRKDNGIKFASIEHEIE